jgi:hydrogenase-4 membrane subunit HyfE
MLDVLFLLIILSIFILWVVWNYKNFVKIYTIQVIMIISIFFIEYSHEFVSDIFIFISFMFAIIVRLIIIPGFLYHFIKTSKLPLVEREFRFWMFYNLIMYFIALAIISYISFKVFWEYNYIFIASLFMVVSWFLNFANHKKLIWDILSFLELENWIFLLSLLVLERISFYLELWIVVDIVMSLAILLISTLKIRSVYWSINIDKLATLKD